MNKHVGIWGLVLALLSGCSEEEVHAPWVSHTTDQTGIAEFMRFSICPDGMGNAYAVQVDTAAQSAACFYYSSEGAWTRSDFAFESRQYYVYDGDDLQAAHDGSVWLIGLTEAIRFLGGQIAQRIALGNSDVVRDFAIHGHEVWMISTNRLMRLDMATGAISSYVSPNYTGGFLKLTVDSEGNKWMACNSVEYNIYGLSAEGTWVKPEDPDSLLKPWESWWGPEPVDFQDATSDLGGNSYFHSSNWANMHRITNGRLVAEALPLGYRETKLQTDHDGRIWLYVDNTWQGFEPLIYRVSGGIAAEEFDFSEALPGNIWLYDLAFDRNNTAWVATNKGVVVYNKDGVR